MKKIPLFLCCLVVAPHLYAGGYRVSIQGQKALGMGHAGVAMSSSAESVFFNPGAITELENDFELAAGLTLLDSKNRYQNVDTGATAETDIPLSTPVNFYIARKYNDNISWGFGLYTPFGSIVEWPQDWSGSHLVEEIELQSIFLQPTIAYKVNDRLSVGAGPIVSVSSVEVERNLSTSLQNANGDRSSVNLEDSGIVDFGLSLGAFYQVNDKLDLGFTYRTEIKPQAEGDADFENIPGPLQGVFVDGGFKAEIPLPAEITLGLTYKLSDRMTLATDYNYAFWDSYEELVFEFDSVTDPTRATSVNPRNYKNSGTFRAGIEYQQNDKFQWRTGFYLDESPIQDGYFAPETPRGDSVGLTGGFTYQLSEKFAMDASALYLYFDEEDNSYDFSDEGSFAGTYKVRAYSLGFGLTYQF
jgi:long-chain fatty acid transport protein